jgi:photosystem II stability/assembly factor-like uncharacterized protein
MKVAMTLFLALATAQWYAIPVPTMASFRGLRAVDENIVWASGTGGTVIRTTDNGKTWSLLPVAGAEALDFRGIHAFSDKAAVIMSSGPAEKGQARIYRTIDAGQHWVLVLEEKTPGAFFDAIAFWDANHGILMGDPVDGHFMLFTTDDGGATWQRVPPEKLPPALPGEGAFAASNSCLAVQGSGKGGDDNAWFATGGASVARVFRSTDRGKTWAVANTPAQPHNASTGIFSIAFRDEKNGVAVGGDYQHPEDSVPNPLVTSDGGKTWNMPATISVIKEAGHYFSSVVFAPNDKGFQDNIFAAGPGGVYALEDGNRWLPQGDMDVNVIAFPNSASPNAKTGWAAGPKGMIARWNFEGAGGVHQR